MDSFQLSSFISTEDIETEIISSDDMARMQVDMMHHVIEVDQQNVDISNAIESQCDKISSEPIPEPQAMSVPTTVPEKPSRNPGRFPVHQTQPSLLYGNCDLIAASVTTTSVQKLTYKLKKVNQFSVKKPASVGRTATPQVPGPVVPSVPSAGVKVSPERAIITNGAPQIPLLVPVANAPCPTISLEEFLNCLKQPSSRFLSNSSSTTIPSDKLVLQNSTLQLTPLGLNIHFRKNLVLIVFFYSWKFC